MTSANPKPTSHKIQIRILAVYGLLILLSFSGAVLAIRRVLLFRLENRLEQALNQEIQEFRVLVGGKDPETAQPFGDNVTGIFDVFLKRNIPIEDEYTIALLPDRFYAAVPASLPEAIRPNSSIVKHWQQLQEPEQGDIGSDEERIVYLAEPVRISGKIKGVFVVAIAIKGELQEVREAILVIVRVTSIAVIITSILAWIFAGKILAPLRLLTQTARAISENNLDRRIEVHGDDEVTQLSRTFNEMLDRLQSAFVSQQQFLNDVSHELKTPISIIQGHLEFMGDTPAERTETQEIIFDELARMNRFISDLMLLAQAEQPNFLHLESVDLETLTTEIFTKAKAIAERKWQLEITATGKVVADRQRLIQAMTNLAQNATKHTKLEDTIGIGSLVRQNNLYLWVKDTGVGIPEAEQKLIFERFKTGTNGYSKKSTGLGLAIVSAIAQAHGGKIELSSSLNRGSTFTVVLPLKREY